ncbi:class I SAM-dependent methyltransferase [Terrarubrum flagellatum]|uniref:class I SAM-dependent methyltransferase n=1 Tax=Terrirubrum flagellatum TaxID=2895980 RepID=UPI003144EFF1
MQTQTRAARSVNRAHFVERACCPACASVNTVEIYAAPLNEPPVRDFIASHYATQGEVNWSYLSGTDYVLDECADCELIFQRFIPNDALLNHIYCEMIDPEKLSRVENSRLTIDTFHRIAGEMDVLFRLAGKPPAEIRFLDYGYGHGRWARVARAMGAEVYATEIGEDKIASAAALGVRMIPDAEIDNMRFDIVHTEQVFVHLVDPAATFKRLAAVTDGIMKVAVPTQTRAKELVQSKGLTAASPFKKIVAGETLSRQDLTYISLQPLEHLNTYSVKTFERLCAAHGMRIISRTRRASIPLNIMTPKLALGSLKRAASMIAKTILPPVSAYFVMSPANRA